jgi:tetratricopeptide (TPR) repeat protein
MAEANPIDKLCQRARQAIEQRDWERARQAYTQALGLKADLPDVHYGLATVYFQLRDLASAARHFKEVTRLDPLRASAFINLGAVFNLLQEYDEAVAVLRRGIQLDATRVEGYYNLGLVYKRMGQPDMAVQAYREALRLNARMPDAQLNLANLYLEKGKYKEAAQHYQQALVLRPGWEKATEGLSQAQEAIAELAASPESGQVELPPALRPARLAEPDRLVDPVLHAAYLTALHAVTSGAEDDAMLFQESLEKKMEPAIKELSSALLYSSRSRSELEDCVARFEAALEDLRARHESMQARIARIRELEQQFPH